MAPRYPWVSLPVANAAWVPTTSSAATARRLVKAESREGEVVAVTPLAGVRLQHTPGLADTASSVPTQPRRFSESELCLDVSRLDVLDDDADERDGACQQHADGLGDRPADLDGEIRGGDQIDEIDPAVHNTDPGGRVVHFHHVPDDDLVAQG